MENNIQLEIYIRKVMYELGFKPNLSGYEIFKDGIITILENNEGKFWSKELYQELGEKHNQTAGSIERNIRSLIATRTKKNNELSQFIFKNNDHIVVSECLALVAEYVKLTTKKDNKQERNISYMAHSLGIPFSSKGYVYLKEALPRVINEKQIIQWMELYKKIAENNNDSMVSVERSFRHIIEVALANHKNNKISNTIYQGRDHLSNSEYITLIAAYIRLSELNEEETIYDKEIIKGEEKQEISGNMTLEQRVEYIIRATGIPTNIKGYYYLKDAIMYVLNNTQSISWTNIYEELANIYMITPSKAERGIRYATAIWAKKLLETNNYNSINKFISNYGIDLTNSEFIGIISEYIKINCKEYRNEQLENKQVLKKNRN